MYMPLAGEPDLTGLMDGLVNASFATTRTPLKGPLTIHPVDGPMERHRFGYMQPAPDAPLLEPSVLDVILVPGLAFDRRGNRLGWGAGYYDQLLVQLDPEVATVGVVPEERIVLSLPREAHDVPCNPPDYREADSSPQARNRPPNPYLSSQIVDTLMFARSWRPLA